VGHSLASAVTVPATFPADNKLYNIKSNDRLLLVHKERDMKKKA